MGILWGQQWNTTTKTIGYSSIHIKHTPKPWSFFGMKSPKIWGYLRNIFFDQPMGLWLLGDARLQQDAELSHASWHHMTSWHDMGMGQNPRYPFCSHQNSWDLWMFIPLNIRYENRYWSIPISRSGHRRVSSYPIPSTTKDTKRRSAFVERWRNWAMNIMKHSRIPLWLVDGYSYYGLQSPIKLVV